MVLTLGALSFAACGSASPPTVASARPATHGDRVEVIPHAFSLRLPDGVVLRMDASGAVQRDGTHVLTLYPDGRLTDAAGGAVATMLADGQIAYRGDLQPTRIHEALPSVLNGEHQTVLRQGPDDLLVLSAERLRIAVHPQWPTGDGTLELEPTAPEAARVAVVFVTTVELLEHPRAAPRERPAEPNAIPPPPDVAAAPPGAVLTASGLSYVVLASGSGTTRPTAQSRVRVHYTGWLTDGSMFDSSVARGEPIELPLNGVIPGWTEGLQLMAEGARYRFWMPPALAYGQRERPRIPAGSTLVFDVELIAILP
jgi:peptidylprolyl isomerase